MHGALDVQDALVASLAGLGLRQISGLQCDGLYLPNWNQNLLRGHELGTILWGKEGEQGGWVCPWLRPFLP